MHLHLFPVPLLVLFIMFIVPVPRVVCEDNEEFVRCGTPYECGNMNISYPFWGGDRPDYCGHPGFNLTCDGEAPEFTMMDASYRVLDINNSSNIVTVARADYWDSDCPTRYVNTTLDTSLFSYNTTYPDVTLFYACPLAIAISNQFNCSNIISYFTTINLNVDISLRSCDVNVTVPIFQSAATAIVSGGGALTLLRAALRGGFGLEWDANNSLCKECVESGGQCGYTSNQFTCYCRDEPSASTCRNTPSSPSPSSPSDFVSCSVSVRVPIFQSAATAIVSGGATLNLLRTALKDGFGLEWNANNSLCKECVESGGQCGYTSNQFTCYCRDEPSSSTCRNTTSPSGSSKNVTPKIVIGIPTGVAGVIIILVLLFGFRKKCLSRTKFSLKKQRKEGQNVEEFIRRYGSLAPKRYNHSDIKKMTNSLAYKLGQGGFGSVYKGKLSDGRLVAVKVLSELKGNGEEFMNEVASISRTSHVNIVMLIGFCYDGAKRALIYEFMPNGSLDKFISDTDLHLEWKTMYQIAVGIGRGLDYLHRGCHTRILHFDIKPHNILLDEDFCPKISDFGLAKLCQGKESIVSMTGARGTAGYIAPEVFCRNFGGVSHKSDVYSYGMLVLELVGGRKNRGAACTSDIYFPDWIYKHLENGEDLILGRVVTQEEEETVRKMILVSLWCIQTNPMDRPSMHKVVEMLEGSLQSLETPPKPFLFSPKKTPQASSTTSLSLSLSVP